MNYFAPNLNSIEYKFPQDSDRFLKELSKGTTTMDYWCLPNPNVLDLYNIRRIVFNIDLAGDFIYDIKFSLMPSSKNSTPATYNEPDFYYLSLDAEGVFLNKSQIEMIKKESPLYINMPCSFPSITLVYSDPTKANVDMKMECKFLKKGEESPNFLEYNYSFDFTSKGDLSEKSVMMKRGLRFISENKKFKLP